MKLWSSMCQSNDDYETRHSGGKGTRDKFQRAPTSKYTSVLAFHPIPHGPTWQGIGPSTSSSAAQHHSQWATVTCAMASKYMRQDLHHHCESTEPAPSDMFISYIYIYIHTVIFSYCCQQEDNYITFQHKRRWGVWQILLDSGELADTTFLHCPFIVTQESVAPSFCNSPD